MTTRLRKNGGHRHELRRRFEHGAKALNAALHHVEKTFEARGYKVEAGVELREGVVLLATKAGQLKIRRGDNEVPIASASLDDRVLAVEHLEDLDQALKDTANGMVEKVLEATEQALCFARGETG